MLTARGRGRLVGGVTFLQLVGLIVPFVLLLPISPFATRPSELRD